MLKARGLDVPSVIRGIAWFHRWTGVALCAAFTVWFASGLVMVFVPFPGLSDADRRGSAQAIARPAGLIAPSIALAAGGGGETLRLVSVAGRPVYVTGDAELRAIDANTGTGLPPISAEAARTIAADFADAPVASIDGAFRYDQWVVHNRFDPWRPLFRVSIDDADGSQLYVSAVTGEVVQRTRAAERAWNWIGAIPHWLYFTAIRKDWGLWDNAMWTIALVGVFTAVAGTGLGLCRTVKRMQGRRPDWSAFRGWLRWHHGLGLAAAVFVLVWMVSGWLSMDHGRLFSKGKPLPEAVAAYRGAPLAVAISGIPASAFADLGGAYEIRFVVVDGIPLAAAYSAGSARVQRLDAPAPATDVLPGDFLSRAVAKHWPVSTPTGLGPGPEDRLYRDADGLAPTALRFDLTQPKDAAVYIDAVTGQPVALIDNSRKAYAWVYYAMHTSKFAGLEDRPILRKSLQVGPLLLGLIFSLTGIVLAFRRVWPKRGRSNHRAASGA